MANRNIVEQIPPNVFTPREYQVELLEDAKERNIIVCLSTGTGKTFIAIMLIKEMAPEIRKPWAEGGKRSFFLVNTVPLVAQQAKAIEQHTDLKVGQFVGSSTLDAWIKRDWDVHLEQNQVLVMSSQIFCNMLLHGFLDVSRVNLLIMDECHHTVKSSPMRQIAQLVHDAPANQRPKMLGLTASIINKKITPSKLESAIVSLQNSMGCAVSTAPDTDIVIKYATRPQEVVVECADLTEPTSLHCQLEAVALRCRQFLTTHRYAPRELYGDMYEEFMTGVPDPVTEPKQIISDFIYILSTLGPWCADRAASYFMVEVEKMRRKTAYDRHFLLLGVVFSDLVRIRTLCDRVFEKLDLREQIWEYSTPKVRRLIEVLQAFAPPSEPGQTTKQDQPPDGSQGSDPPPAEKTGTSQPPEGGTDASQPPEGGTDAARTAENGAVTSEQGSGEGRKEAEQGSGQTTEQSAGAAGAEEADRARLQPRFTYNPEDPAAVCGLVFVKQRITAKVLYKLIMELRDVSPELSFLYPQYIVGGTSKSFMEPAEVGQAERKKQEDVLCRFRQFECNLLVATSVLEEGVDVPQCNLVVRFDAPTEYRSYVQSKGRARAAAAHYVLLATRNELEQLLRELSDYHVIERRLTAHCLEDSEEPSETDQLRELAERRILPYRPSDAPNAPLVTRNSCISLVNRYCNRLPSDTFTRLTPQWKMEEERQEDLPPLRRCHLRLPVNSPVKDIVLGDWFPSKLLARQSAALKMCRVIYEAGELDEYLLPIGKEALLEEGADEQREWVADGAPRPGTTKRRQYYKKQMAPALTGPALQPGQRCYLYQFDMRLTCPIPEDQNTRGRRLFHPENDPRRLGLITAHPLPEVCAFPIFTRSGEVVVSVRLVTDQLQPTQHQLKLLAQFHQFVFCGVLRLEKFPMRFQPDDSATGFLVVPINVDVSGSGGGLTVDWPFLELVTPRYEDHLEPLSDEQRKNFQFNRQTFLDAVIMPWYRNQDQPQFFYVAEICQKLNPGSAFPDDHFRTFTEYYESKYGIRIQNQTQPLLDVDHTSARLNLLTPRFVNRKGVALPPASSETKRAKRESLQQKQILVPELCMVHPFPASLWRKVVTLPSVLYRLNGVMVADGLRRRVAEEIQLGTPALSPGRGWPQLDFGWSLAEVLERRDKLASADRGGAGDRDGETLSPDRHGETDGDGDGQPAAGRPAGEGRRPRRQQFDIGTWSNDLLESESAGGAADDLELAALGPDLTLPAAITLLAEPAENDELAAVTWGAAAGDAPVRYGSPTYLSGGGGGGGGGGWGDAWGDGGSMGSQSDLSDSSEEEDDDDEGPAAAARPAGAPPAPPPAPPEQEEEEDVFDFDEDSITLQEVRQRMARKVAAVNSYLRSDCLLSADASLQTLASARRRAAAVKAADTAARWSGAAPALTRTAAAAAGTARTTGTTRTPWASRNADDTGTTASAASVRAAEERRLAASAPPQAVRRAQPPSSGTTTRPDAETRSGDVLPEGAAGCVIVATPAAGGPTAFDLQPDLDRHPGPSPALLLQALTMSNANDGINLERLETVGDSFLKFAITVHLYLTYPTIHEGKLSYLRSKQVSNLNLYRLGRDKCLGELMVAAKFEPHDNWLPPGYTVPEGLEEEIVESGVTASHLNLADMTDLAQVSGEEEVRQLVRDKCQRMKQLAEDTSLDTGAMPSFLPYNLLTQHSIPDKSIADCVESLIGAYLVSCGPKGALVFMSWLGIKVLPRLDGVDEAAPRNKLLERQRRRPAAHPRPISSRILYGDLPEPASPLYAQLPNPLAMAAPLLSGLDKFEELIQYEFRDKFYLLQAFTHASFHANTLTDCYQRLEFLGDAVLDYLITRHLYEDRRNHSPGALTDLRSALVNNAIFATLAVRYDFHKYFRHYSPGLNQVITKFLSAYGDGGCISEYLYIQEDECEAAEDIEVPKALGDVFESVAGAIYLDSGMSLDTVWRVYFRIMQTEIETFSEHVPMSPIRELLELEPETAKFRKPERQMNGKVRVTVEVIGKGSYKGLGRNYRIAKCTAAKRALRALKRLKANRVP